MGCWSPLCCRCCSWLSWWGGQELQGVGDERHCSGPWGCCGAQQVHSVSLTCVSCKDQACLQDPPLEEKARSRKVDKRSTTYPVGPFRPPSPRLTVDRTKVGPPKNAACCHLTTSGHGPVSPPDLDHLPQGVRNVHVELLVQMHAKSCAFVAACLMLATLMGGAQYRSVAQPASWPPSLRSDGRPWGSTVGRIPQQNGGSQEYS